MCGVEDVTFLSIFSKELVEYTYSNIQKENLKTFLDPRHACCKCTDKYFSNVCTKFIHLEYKIIKAFDRAYAE